MGGVWKPYLTEVEAPLGGVQEMSLSLRKSLESQLGPEGAPGHKTKSSSHLVCPLFKGKPSMGWGRIVPQALSLRDFGQ